MYLLFELEYYGICIYNLNQNIMNRVYVYVKEMLSDQWLLFYFYLKYYVKYLRFLQNREIIYYGLIF